MIEKLFNFYTGNEKTIEKVIKDDNIHLMHMVLNNGENLPEHFTNANIYMVVVRGVLNIQLDDQSVNEYKSGHVLNIPLGIKMQVKNIYNEVLELFVIKAPAPENNIL
ncbi:MAG: hypothetical protein DBX47_04600 [Clostridiales bacterium]|nr:MAG: hypothetical protein DBX47_04600 [Clostridiales bacterium]